MVVKVCWGGGESKQHHGQQGKLRAAVLHTICCLPQLVLNDNPVKTPLQLTSSEMLCLVYLGSTSAAWHSSLQVPCNISWAFQPLAASYPLMLHGCGPFLGSIAFSTHNWCTKPSGMPRKAGCQFCDCLNNLLMKAWGRNRT